MVAPATRTLETQSLEATQALGASIAALLQPGDVLALIGELGAGKTAFTQGLGRALGIRQAMTSPTFTLINQYRTTRGALLQHVDCYRLTDATAEMWDAGLADLLAGDDIVVIEWADRVRSLLPEERLELLFEYVSDGARRITLTGHGERYRALLERIDAARP